MRILKSLCSALAGFLACAAGTIVAAGPVAPALQVGSLLLRPCPTLGAWCGNFSRPLDPHGTVPGLMPIYFEYYPHRDAGPLLGTLVATESRADYLPLFESLRALHGNEAGAPQLRAVTAALQTAGDALARAPDLASGAGVGLRGGTDEVQVSADVFRPMLHELRWTADLAVSGVVDAPTRSGAAHASLRLVGEPKLSGVLKIDWREGEPLAGATVRGTLGGQTVVAEQAAP